MEWLLELALIGLLLATMFHAVRLERALGVLKRDRAALEELVAGFNASTQAAEQGIARLKEAADGAGRQIARQVDAATRLKDDLVFLGERGGVLADRLDVLVRAGRTLELSAPPVRREPEMDSWKSAEPMGRESMSRESVVREPMVRESMVRESMVRGSGEADARESAEPRPRSQAERDLMRALKLAR